MVAKQVITIDAHRLETCLMIADQLQLVHQAQRAVPAAVDPLVAQMLMDRAIAIGTASQSDYLLVQWTPLSAHLRHGKPVWTTIWWKTPSGPRLWQKELIVCRAPRRRATLSDHLPGGDQLPAPRARSAGLPQPDASGDKILPPWGGGGNEQPDCLTLNKPKTH